MGMLLDKDKRGIATAIVAKANGSGGYDESGKSSKTDKSAAKSGAMTSFLSAMDRKDAEGMSRALGSFHDLHSSRDDEEGISQEGPTGPASELQKAGGFEQTRKEWS